MDFAAHLAPLIGAAMVSKDAVATALGMKLVSIAPGAAEVEMQVRADMVNALGLCSGGALYSVGEFALMLAANSHNRRAVLQSASMQHLAAAKADDVLRAGARELSRRARSAVYVVEICNANGECVADMRGQARFVRGEWIQAFTP